MTNGKVSNLDTEKAKEIEDLLWEVFHWAETDFPDIPKEDNNRMKWRKLAYFFNELSKRQEDD